MKKRRQEFDNQKAAKNQRITESSNEDEINLDRLSTKKPEIFVDYLLKHNETSASSEILFSDDQIRDHVLTILSAVSITV